MGNIRNSVGTASNGSAAGAAVPDTDRLSSDGGLSAEGAGVLGVLGDFHLLHLLSQGGTVTITSCISCQFIWRFPSDCDRFRVSSIKSREVAIDTAQSIRKLFSRNCNRSRAKTIGNSFSSGSGSICRIEDGNCCASFETHRVPYLPLRQVSRHSFNKFVPSKSYTYVTPTFLVRLVILTDLCGWGCLVA